MKVPRKKLLSVLAGGLLALGLSLRSEPAGGNPLGRYGLSSSERFTARGQVLERLDAGSYRYLKVATQAGARVWVATLAATASDADQVEVLVFARAKDFKSQRLNRSFDELWFAAVHAAPTDTLASGAMP